MKKNILFQTNISICIILIIGFLMTAVLGYHANYQESVAHLEQVSNLTSEGLEHQMNTLFHKPVNISLTMANDDLLTRYLEEERMETDTDYIAHITSYLKAYQEKYQYYDSIFLVSEKTQRYYTMNGLDRILDHDDPENAWYETLKQQEKEYNLVVDHDEVQGADNALTVFVNCKIISSDGKFLGAVGVGLRTDALQQILNVYERDYDVEAYLIDQTGEIQISVSHTGYEDFNIFDMKEYQPLKDRLYVLQCDFSTLEFWDDQAADQGSSYIVARSLPELSWILVVERNTGTLFHDLSMRIYQTVFIVSGIIVITLFIITKLIRKFNHQIIKLQSESEETFRRITEQMYDNIYELNITKNCCVGESTIRYFKSLGAPEEMPYGEALYVIAGKQIKEEYQEGYISTFTPEHVQEVYDEGINHLQYDFMISQDGETYYWMKIDARLFFNQEDGCLHMLTYRKNIDEEKKQELSIRLQAQTDEMTKLYSKTATEQIINHILYERPEEYFVFMIFDIDNFKSANDCFGHMFGDEVIKEFAGMIKENLRPDDIVGRIGGDEFVAFLSMQEEASIKRKINQLSDVLNLEYEYKGNTWHLTTSIGVSFAPKHGSEFIQLYAKADEALYLTKNNGKHGYTIYSEDENDRNSI